MVGAEDCPKCRQARELLQARGLWDGIEYVHTGSRRGRELAAKYGQQFLPFYVLDGKAYVYTGEIMRIMEERREAQA